MATDQQDHVASIKDRQIKSMDRRPAPGMASELGLLVLLLGSGAAGLALRNATLTFTLFLGGFMMWVGLTLPELIASFRGKAPEQKEGKEDKAAAAAGEAQPPQPPPLPSPSAVLSLIKRRRSVFPKDYNGQPVTKEELDMLLEAANWAPTHGLTEPWRWVVLRGGSKVAMEELTVRLCRERLPEEKAAKTLEKLEKKRDTTWGKISCYIAIVCKRQAKPEKLMPEWEEMAAVSCAVQNMWLLATSMGLAAYWTSWQEVAREAPEMKALLGAAPEDRVMGFLTLGRSERAAGYRGSRAPWADKVTWTE